MPQKERCKGSSITCFVFGTLSVHFSVTFSDASVTFLVTFLPNSFCRTPFAAGVTKPFKGLIDALVAILLQLGPKRLRSRNGIEKHKPIRSWKTEIKIAAPAYQALNRTQGTTKTRKLKPKRQEKHLRDQGSAAVLPEGVLDHQSSPKWSS